MGTPSSDVRLRQFSFGVLAGTGVVGRYPRLALVALPEQPAHAEFVDDLLRVTDMFGARPDAPGREVARRVAGLIALSESDRVPPFCVLADVDTGTAVLVHGDIEVVVSGAHVLQRISGASVLSWVDMVITEPYEQISVAPTDTAEAKPQRWTDLREGIVRGSGLLATLGRRPQAASSDEGMDPATDLATLVEPGHFLDSGPAVATMQILRLEDGSGFELSTNYVLGRNPELHPDVQQGTARALVLEDGEELISRVHARLVVDQHGVSIIDEGSANGTFVSPPGAEGWDQVPTAIPVRLTAGTRMLIGERILRIDDGGPAI